MQIQHINTFLQGGAAIAAHRLHKALLQENISSTMSVLHKDSDEQEIKQLCTGRFKSFKRFLTQKIENLPLKIYKRPAKKSYVSFSFLPTGAAKEINAQPHDIAHLHWITAGFLSPWDIQKITKPVVWTLHDTWAFTGGCHYFYDCTGYLTGCGQCPQLSSAHPFDLSKFHWKLKEKAILKKKPAIVTTNTAFTKMVQKSPLFQACTIKTIPNAINTQHFAPYNQNIARSLLNIPNDAFIIFFGAYSATTDYNKGFDLLLRALQKMKLNEIKKNIVCIIAGATHGETKNIPYPVVFLGHLHDALTMTLAYNASDVFVCPSRNENFPNTILESLACGTPVVSFAIGGIPDMIDHEINGYLATPYDTEDLAKGILTILSNTELRKNMGIAAREKVEKNYAMSIIAKQYIDLYTEILQNSRK